MGLGEAVLLGLVLLLSGGSLCAATQSWFNISANDTLNLTPQRGRAGTSSRPPTSPQASGHQPNRTDPERSPVSYRLKSHWLRDPAPPLAEQMQTQNPQMAEAAGLTPERLEPRETVQTPTELVKLLVQGPDLNPPVRQETKVLLKKKTYAALFDPLHPFEFSVTRCE